MELIKYQNHPTGTGIHMIYRAKNGYGASVVQFKIGDGTRWGSYTDNEFEWELAVIKFENESNDSWDVCTDTPITDNVIGHLSQEEVKKIFKKIEKLEAKK